MFKRNLWLSFILLAIAVLTIGCSSGDDSTAEKSDDKAEPIKLRLA